jgi:hypothetical protein
MYRKVRVGEEADLGMPAPVVEIFHVAGRGRALGELARHQRTPQLLAAMDGGRWGMWLAPPGDAPRDPVWIELAADEALLLDAGVWHRGPVPLDRPAGTYLTVEAPGTNAVDFESRGVDAPKR